jgi:GTP-binding protein EngB required for normal cell division
MTTGLNENHKRHLLQTFEHVDHVLEDALQALRSADVPSPFARYVPDSLPVQRRVLGDYIARLRGVMAQMLERQGIALPKPRVSSLWAFHTTLLTAKISVEELGSRYMRGYGALSDEAARELEAMTAQTMDVLDRISGYLARGAGQDLQTRLERLEKAVREVEWTTVLEQVITARGLVELRPSLDVVVERLESSRLEVAVFGRVSSGKSSLLNHILRTEALPVGVTPVTAIPTRVAFGSRPLARIWFAQAETMAVELHELTQYVTEQGNPENARHVTRVQVELPSDRLKEGVTFVDTPGLGSLARYGEMESLAYLPRCDLGIVLVDASSTVVQEDAFTVNALRQAGAEVMVLLTKADVLARDERPAAAQYVADQLKANLGFDVPVHIVSVKGPDAVLCDLWFETALVPCLREHDQLARASLRRKVGLLRDGTIAALERRLDRRPVVAGDLANRWAAADATLGAVLVRLDAAAAERLESRGLAERVLETAAQEVVGTWWREGGAPVDAAGAVASSADQHAHDLAADVAKSVLRLREGLGTALREAAAAVGSAGDEADELPVPRGMPVPNPSESLPEMPLRRSTVLCLSRELAFRRARAELTRRLGPRISDQLEQYVKQLETWRAQVLAQLRRSFTARADFYRAQGERAPGDSDPASLERDLKRLRALQEPQPPDSD